MTLKQQVIDAIYNEYPDGLTNQQLAARLDANEPSIRRITKQLEGVEFRSTYDRAYDNVLTWRALHMSV